MSTHHVEAHLIAHAVTDRGLVRENNEDTFEVADLTTGRHGNRSGFVSCPVGRRGVLLLVSDGMGGAAAGEVASALAVETVRSVLASEDLTEPDAALERAVERANRGIRDAAIPPDRSGMGATLVGVLVEGTHAHVASVGDSRAYLIRAGEIAPLTEDHSVVNLLVKTGVLTRQEAARSAHRNVLLQALGHGDRIVVAMARLELRDGDLLLLCTDGLTNLVADDEILTAVLRGDSLTSACEHLVDLAISRGGSDNITAVLAAITGPSLAKPRPGEPILGTLTPLRTYSS